MKNFKEFLSEFEIEGDNYSSKYQKQIIYLIKGKDPDESIDKLNEDLYKFAHQLPNFTVIEQLKDPDIHLNIREIDDILYLEVDINTELEAPYINKYSESKLMNDIVSVFNVWLLRLYKYEGFPEFELKEHSV